MLTCHSRIAIPRASHFIVELHEQFQGRDLSDDQAARELIDKLLSHEQVADFEIDRSRARARMEALSERSIAAYCRVVFEEYARDRGKSRWGDKTTTYGPHTALLADMFEDITIVHLIRDGRDVVTSLLNVPFGQRTVVDAALHWKETVQAIRRGGSHLAPRRYLEFRYESILENPEAALTELCAFLGEEFEPGMLGYTDKVNELILPHDNPYHRKLREPPSKDMLYKWKREMPEQDRAVVEHLAGDLLSELGYEISGARMSGATRRNVYKILARRAGSRLKARVRRMPLPQKALVKKVVLDGSDLLHPARLRAVLAGPHDNIDRLTHLQEALAWICRAQDAGGDDGVARGVKLGVGVFQPSYPETTGYIIPTMLKAAQRWENAEYRDRAIRMGDWEIEIQMKSGAVMGGIIGRRNAPAVFNTGQVMLGWNALFESTGDEKYLEAAKRAADWLVEIQEANGNWIKGHSERAAPNSTIYNARVAWALAETGRLCRNDSYLKSAESFIDYALEHQRDNGWFSDCCLTDPQRPLLHTLAYTMRGVFEAGRVLKRADYIDAARLTADSLLNRIDAGGFLPGRFTGDWRGAVRWCCLTGSAQTSIMLSKLARHTGRTEYADGAARLNDYLMRRHVVTGSDPTIRGGVYGSWPPGGAYCRFEVVNWAVKFLIDALMEEGLSQDDG
jgi:rhamnogalacturonyl hydrolase YesR